MKKVYVYKMHAGTMCTDESFALVLEEPLSSSMEWDYAMEHAECYGNEQDEDGEWYQGGYPECWLSATVTTIEELRDPADYILCGGEAFETLVKTLEEEGMVWQ